MYTKLFVNSNVFDCTIFCAPYFSLYNDVFPLLSATSLMPFCGGGDGGGGD